MKRRSKNYDKRLIGTWKSDRRKTFEHFKPKRGSSASSFMKLRSIFGHFTVEWRRSTFVSWFDGGPDWLTGEKDLVVKDTQKYVVIDSDPDSVVIRFHSELFGGERLQHIHFLDEKYYWVSISGTLNEWFRRVD
jgi:hypothetical protein